MEIRSTLDTEHYKSTKNEIGGFNSIGGSNGYWYMYANPGLYDYNYTRSSLGEYCTETEDYIMFILTNIDTDGDYLSVIYTRYRKSDGYMDFGALNDVVDASSVYLAKVDNGIIYITGKFSTDYEYVSLNISTLAYSVTSGQYTSGYDLGNSSITYNGYKLSTKGSNATYSSGYRVKQAIRMEKII